MALLHSIRDSYQGLGQDNVARGVPKGQMLKTMGMPGRQQWRAMAHAVSRWLPTAAAWVRAQVWSCGICGGQSGTRAGFLRVLRFLPPIFIPACSWYNRPVVAAVPSGLSLTPLTIIKK
jgi:hypothetical protein